jgi:hypothetical protein
MPFAQLYEAVQAEGADRISTNWLRTKAMELSRITKIKEQWTGLINPEVVRGFYIEGPKGPPVALEKNEALIVIARAICLGPLGDHWRRVVLTKELMHVFDEEKERTKTRETFDAMINKFKDLNAPMTDQFNSEVKAYWRAHAVLCTQNKRNEFKDALVKEKTTVDVVGAALRVPPQFVRVMMSDDYDKNLPRIM